MLIQLFELYAKDGVSLSDQGINEAVLPINLTSKVLGLFKENKILVLGGDLYKKKNDGIMQYIEIDWFYSGNDYIESIENAKDFLAEYDNTDYFVSYILA